jgi:hypothetical protein
VHQVDPEAVFATAWDLIQDPNYVLTWTDIGHPAYDQPGASIPGPFGPTPIDAPPPRPGPRYGSGDVH